MKKFALIGAAGYVAPRHMKAIRDTGNTLIAALDRNDSVGIIDSFFPEARFFTEFERFDRYVDKLGRNASEEGIDYISVCSPNYLHDSHMRFALRSGANAICEKPAVLNTRNIDGLISMEEATGREISTILQLRLHPTILALKKEYSLKPNTQKHSVDLTYITSRGRWYHQSWKGDEGKSGGIASNIGVHFYDMLHFLFGDLQENILHYSSASKAGGYLEYENARVRWFLSVDKNDIPTAASNDGQSTYRSISIDEDEVEFSSGFGDLHTKSYEEILAGRGFTLEENRVAISTVADIRNQKAIGLAGDYHPYLKNISV